MAKFAKSLDGKLTLVFENSDDLLKISESILQTVGYLVGKYGSDESGNAILAVLDIKALETASGTSSALS